MAAAAVPPFPARGDTNPPSSGPRLAGHRAAIVTGAASGIGRAIATALAAEGVGLVVCADLTPEPGTGEGAVWEDLEEDRKRSTHELIAARHGTGRAIFIRCNIAVERAADSSGPAVATEAGAIAPQDVWGIADVVDETVRRAGRLDIVVNNAGVGTNDVPLHEMGVAEWDQTHGVNGRGTFLGCKHTVAQFLRQEPDASTGCRGSLVNISGIGGEYGLMKCSAFCASQASIIGLSRSLALEYAREGIRCNVVLPGYIQTPFAMTWYRTIPEFAGYLDSMIPMGRLGRPLDVASAVVWLASSRESGYVTGITLPVDGGFTVR